MKRAHFILFVRDTKRSRDFYTSVLNVRPELDVDGMVELPLPGGALLGLMPESGIIRLLGGRVDPTSAGRVPRAELYLVVDEVRPYWDRAIANGAATLSPPQARDWGHVAGYLSDPDGHVIAFAEA
jgi:catechol 2,3-dioxygenase-like lactoylglutathione lyase family enzyme